MGFIDSWIVDAYMGTDMKDAKVPREQLEHLSQAWRSSAGREILEEAFGMRLPGRDSLKLLFEKIAEGRVDLAKALENPRLEHYGKRTGIAQLD